jgi:GMP synthase (glutamine-hydrolysing)
MVTDREPWSVASAAWLHDVWEHGKPILGICYGHQLLADALGGRVDRNPAGREIGTVCLDRTAAGREDPLLCVLDDRFFAQESHSESVVELPPGATLIATNPHAPNQAFSLGHAWGVQFHPEFDADIVRGYIRGRADALRREGLDPDRLDSEVKESDAGPRLLRRFRELASER